MGFSCSVHSAFRLGEPDVNSVVFSCSRHRLWVFGSCSYFQCLFRLWLSAIYNFRRSWFMSFLIFGAIYCFSGGCLFVCFFLTVQATIFWWDILNLSLGPSCHRISWNHSLFGLLVKIIRLGNSNLNYLSKENNCGIILMGVFPHLKVSRLCLSGKFMMLRLCLGSLARLSLTLFSI